MEKYGFVYIWYDKKRTMYYVGCHWGSENDGYLCSNERMRINYKRRPQDFKRRILERVDNRKDLFWSEACWLWFIAPDELGKRYYNVCRTPIHHWSSDPEKKLSVAEKSSQWMKQYAASMSAEERSERWGHWKGKSTTNPKRSETLKEKYANGWIGAKGYKHTEEWKQQRSEYNIENNIKPPKGKPFEKGNIPATKGKPRSDSVKMKIGKKNKINMLRLWQDPEYRQRQSEAHKK